LPEDSNGIHVNVSTTLGAPFVYQIDGPNAVYVGGGFKHETKYAKYNNTGIRKTLGDLRREANYDSTYTGAKLDETGCPITLHLYPSDDMRDRFITHSPLIFTFGALLIFAFCLLVFYLFDVNVERRQTTVMKTAVRSSAIVSDLFPAAVRDRLYPTESTIFSKPNKKSIRFEGMPNDNVDGAATTRSKPLTDRPNAELYPETTILFADLAGFTFWCSTRQPAQVFHLLETLYGAFDAIAKQRGVYKVETIGDCYVAAVGLPTPRRHHAVVMARFAADCRTRMRELIVTELETTSGAVRRLPLRLKPPFFLFCRPI
jgi:Adenylate and Guanylate cyclase catalytic domain